MRLAFAPYLLHFKEPGGTSRGVMTEKPTFLIKVYDEAEPSRFGIGEAAVFRDYRLRPMEIMYGSSPNFLLMWP